MPVENPPAVIQPAPDQQSQSQFQDQSQTNAPSISSSNSNNAGANSATESTAVLNQGGELSNYQINNNSNSEYGFSTGVAAPVPTINITSYSHSGSNGIAATLTIPIGGAVGRQHKTLINSRIKRIDLDNNAIALQGELELATACAKIAAANVSIDFSQFPLLSRCQFVTVRSPLPLPPVILPPPIQMLVPPVIRTEPPKEKLPSKPKRPISGLW